MQIRFRLDLNSDQVRQNLLQGMDNWVQLGLLSDEQVKEISATLSERLPDPRIASESGQGSQRLRVASGELAFTGFVTSENLAAPASAKTPDIADSNQAPSPARTSGLSRAIQSLLSEISVIWLLFLGVFLVVVSSGVLAASQWQSFSAVGQYAILFAYTLTFWGASLWTGKREQLQTTAKMLSLATALLIPINFWMIDALSVFGSITGIGFGILAAVILSLIAFRLLDSQFNKLNLIGLSWLHLGWMSGGIFGGIFWPVAATYLGTIGSAANLFYQDRQSAPELVASDDAELSENRPATSTRFSLDTLTVAIAIIILLFRSLFITQVPPHQLGLAAGICGGLAIWLSRTKATRFFWNFAGFGLSFLGWTVSNSQSPPWQAIGVSAIALYILWDKLKQTWQPPYLLAVIVVACQTYILLWSALPIIARESALSALAQISSGPTDNLVWASLGLFPVLLAMLLLAKRLRHWQQSKLAQQTELVTLAFGAALIALSLPSSFTIAANLTLSTFTLIALGRNRHSLKIATLTHIVGLLAIATSIYYFAPDLTVQRWTYVALGSGMAEILIHVVSRSDRWRKNLWFGGIGLLAIAYFLLVTHYDQQPSWLWLPIPVLFCAIANHRRTLYPKTAAVLSTGAFILQTPWIFLSWATAIINFAIATLCTGLNSRIWRSLPATLFAVGEVIALTNSILLYGFTRFSDPDPGWFLSLCAIEIWALWLLPRLISRRSGLLSALYQKSCLLWSFALLALFALTQTIIAVAFPSSLYTPSPNPLAYSILATILLAAALLENIHHRPAEWKYWSFGWAVASIVVLGLLASGTTGAHEYGIACLILAFVAQIMGDLWIKKHPGYRISWHGIPLLYASIGGWLGHITSHALTRGLPEGLPDSQLILSAETGLYTIAATVIFTAIGRRDPKLNPLSYLGLLAFTAGAYELLIYQLSQASSGSPGDGVTLLAALALVIALVEKWLSPWLQRYLKLSIAAVQNTAHLHWVFGSILSVLALTAELSQPTGTRLWTSISLLLAAYALTVGNRRWTPQTHITNHTVWTSVGLLEVLLCLTFSRFELFFDRAVLLTWAGVITCIASTIIYRLPWDRWGWPLRPFRLLSIWLPMLTIATTILQIEIPGLLAVSAFYAGMSKACNRIRLSYLSIFLLDWAIFDYLDSQSLLTALGVALITGLSMLYIAQVDPYFQAIQQRQQRHILRILASVAIALTALYQAETAEPMLLYAGLTLVLCLGFIFAGLMLKVRAFLYVGTLTFVVQIIRVLWLFISTYSLLLWAVGIVLGLIFIWIAATFESRRSQVTQLLDTWTAALDTWD